MFDTARAQEPLPGRGGRLLRRLGHRRGGHEPGRAEGRRGEGAARGYQAVTGDATAAGPRTGSTRPSRSSTPSSSSSRGSRSPSAPSSSSTPSRSSWRSAAGARPAARHRREPPAGRAIGAARGGRGGAGRLRDRHRAGVRPGRRDPPALRPDRLRPHRQRGSSCSPAPSPSPSAWASSSRWRRPTCPPVARVGRHRLPRCATTPPSPRAGCAGASPSAASSSSRASARWRQGSPTWARSRRTCWVAASSGSSSAPPC